MSQKQQNSDSISETIAKQQPQQTIIIQNIDIQLRDLMDKSHSNKNLTTNSLFIKNILNSDLDKETKNNNFNMIQFECATANNNSNSMVNCGSPMVYKNMYQKLNARRRWKILAQAIQQSRKEMAEEVNNDVQQVSVRRFQGFELIKRENLQNHVKTQFLGSSDDWYSYKIFENSQDYSVNVHHINRPWTARDLIGFNNTGNICVWPSEEALACYVLKDLTAFRNSWILELGGGMTCLAGLMIAKYGEPFLIHLTDGNHLSVENVKRSIRLNDFDCFAKSSVLKWEHSNKRLRAEENKYDFILSADCLFFDESRNALIETILYYLSSNGVALIMAPKRGNTLNCFLKRVKEKGLEYQLEQTYNETIWCKHLDLIKSKDYDEDIHYPLLVKLWKRK
jgi:calmodulin-lysine N-methyltransferase